MIALYVLVGFLACSLIVFAAMVWVGKKVCDSVFKTPK